MLSESHRQELQASAIAPEIIEQNFKSLEGQTPYSYLLTSDKLERTNTGCLAGKWLKRYKHLDDGGWWCSGIDPLNDYQAMEWGCFKPNNPKRYDDGKLIKYEHPPKTETRAFFLGTGDYWRKVIPNSEIPVTITEGAKKTGALASASKAAVGLPGIFNGYRTPTDENGNRILKHRHLIPELEILTQAGEGREIYIGFDQDTNPKTITLVNQATSTLGELLIKAGCQVKILTWDAALGKGIDDVLANHGREALDKIYAKALSLHQWQRLQLSALTYPANLTVNRRYLGALPVPELERFVCIIAQKGTGKTESIAGVINAVDGALALGNPVLVLTHRTQLGEALCNRFGVPYVTQISESATGKLFGYGLCVDSLHPNSQARFSAEGWGNATVIIDEAEQVIWHMLSASTEVKKQRVNVLRQFKQLITNVFAEGGRVILSDADLSDVSIDLIRGLSGVNVRPWIVKNEWKPEKGWTVYNYNDTTPAGLVAALEQHMTEGGRPLVLCNGQKIKSKFGTQTLEARFKSIFPEKKGLRIDSETVADPSHPAFNCIANINEIVKDYDYVIGSPSIETGVSMDVREHFSSVWAIAQGSLAENSVRQQLARLREGVDRHLWAASFGGSLIGNGSGNYKSVLASEDKLFKYNLRQLQDADFNLEEIDGDFEPVYLRAWAKMAARINAGKIHYRESIIQGLQDEGHQIVDVFSDKEESKLMSEVLSNTRDENHQAEAEAEAEIALLTPADAEELSKKKAKTQDERRAERKYNRHVRYGGVDVTPDLILKDDDGWHPKIQMHYYATIGREHLQARDAKRLERQLEAGNMALWKPDFNASQLGAAVRCIEWLGILDLLSPGREYRKTDEDLEKLAATAKLNAASIKLTLGVTVRESDTPIAIIQNLLDKVGQKLSLLRREGTAKRTRVYTYLPPQDGREEIFEAWLVRDTSTPCNRDSEVMVTGTGQATSTPCSRDSESLPIPEAPATPIPTTWRENLARDIKAAWKKSGLTKGQMVRWGSQVTKVRDVGLGAVWCWLEGIDGKVPLAEVQPV